MIVRVEFFGIVIEGGKRRKMRDHVDIHAGTVKSASNFFKSVLVSNNVMAVRGDSGVFHPLRKEGKIEVIGIKQVK